MKAAWNRWLVVTRYLLPLKLTLSLQLKTCQISHTFAPTNITTWSNYFLYVCRWSCVVSKYKFKILSPLKPKTNVILTVPWHPPTNLSTKEKLSIIIRKKYVLYVQCTVHNTFKNRTVFHYRNDEKWLIQLILLKIIHAEAEHFLTLFLGFGRF